MSNYSPVSNLVRLQPLNDLGDALSTVILVHLNFRFDAMTSREFEHIIVDLSRSHQGRLQVIALPEYWPGPDILSASSFHSSLQCATETYGTVRGPEVGAARRTTVPSLARTFLFKNLK